MQVKKAIFLGVRKLHSNKKNQDYRTVEIYTPLFKDERGFECGGVQTFFTPLDSKLGDGLPVGTIVKPEFLYNPYNGRSDLSALNIVAKTPYTSDAFN